VGSHVSLLHFTKSYACLHYLAHTFSYLCLPPDSVSSLVFLYLSHHLPHGTYFSSSSDHHLSITCPSHLNQLLLTSVTSSISIFTLSTTFDTSSLRDKLYIHHSIHISVCSNCPICSSFMAQLSFLYTTALTHVTKIPDNSLNYPEA